MLYTVLKPFVAALMRLVFGLRGHGAAHVPPAGPVLLVANHASLLDPPLVGAVAPRPLSFLAKAELFEVPLFGRLIRALNARPVRREGADPAALRTALRVLEEGAALLVFPEGTRSDDGALRAAKPGAGMLAVLSGAPVVPVYIRGSGRAWPRGARWPRPGKITVSFGPALSFERPDGPSRKEQYQAASDEMMAAIARLQATATGGPPVAPCEVRAVGGGGARRPGLTPHYIDGRNGRHGEG